MRMRDANRAMDHAHNHLVRTVREARDAGIPWAEIGKAVNMSLSGAYNYFNRRIKIGR